MARALTRAQSERRSAILERLRAVDQATPDQLRSYLAHDKRIFITVDTVQADLRAMEKAGTVRRGHRTWASGTYWGLCDATT